MNLNAHVYRNLMAACSVLGISRAKLATRAGVGRSTLYRITPFSGTRPRTEDLERVSESLGLTVSELCWTPGDAAVACRYEGAPTSNWSPNTFDWASRLSRFASVRELALTAIAGEATRSVHCGILACHGYAKRDCRYERPDFDPVVEEPLFALEPAQIPRPDNKARE